MAVPWFYSAGSLRATGRVSVHLLMPPRTRAPLSLVFSEVIIIDKGLGHDNEIGNTA